MTGFIVFIAFCVAAIMLSGGRPRKIAAVIAGLCGFGLAYLFRFDQGEGPVIRPLGITVGVIAFMVYLEELKNQVLESLQDRLTALHMKDILQPPSSGDSSPRADAGRGTPEK